MRVVGLLGLLATVTFSGAIRLGEEGGYDLVLELKDVPKDVEELAVDPVVYVDNIQVSLDNLSKLMWSATNQTFWIRSAEIIIPREWEAEFMNYKNASSYSPADIQISSKIPYPFVQNPVICGLPGDHIELPFNFFDVQAEEQKYGGNIFKPLMALWARYRWGVWEEHGYPGNSRFPYFFQNVNNEFTVTGCNNNTNLEGKFRNKDNKACHLDNDPTCRFHPDSKSSARRSSLMHFYWLDSVTEFCNSSSHQKHDPNPQNLFCDRKSVQEVIWKSMDFKKVTKKVEKFEYPIITIASRFREAPVLYLLIDSGFNQAVQLRLVLLAQILDFIASTNPILGLGYFPTSETDTRLKELVEFKLFGGNENEFLWSIFNLSVIPAPERDFGSAILQAVDLIREASPEDGGTILILKTGRALINTNFPLEKELKVTLKQEKINLFGIEILEEGNSSNLNNLAVKIVEAKGYPEVTEDLRVLFEKIKEIWEEGNFPREDGPVIAWKGEVKPNETIVFPIPSKGTVTFDLVTPESLYTQNIVSTINNWRAKFNESSNEYGETKNPRYVYTSEIVKIQKENLEASFNFTAVQPAHLIVTSEASDVEEVKVQVTTSIPNRTLSLIDLPNDEVPFGIYAYLTFTNGTPIAGARVSAEVTGVNNSRETLSLKDDGWFNDETSNDGVYSGVYVPPIDGNYSLRVTAVGPGKVTSLGFASQLLPEKQDFDTQEISTAMPLLTKTVGLPGNFEISNRASYYPVITTIRDLEITSHENDPDQTELQFNLSPARALGRTNVLLQYNFYMARSPDDLLKIDVTSSKLPPGVEHISSFPTKLIEYSPIIPLYRPKEKGRFYFVIVVVPLEGYIRASKLSNIVSYDIGNVQTLPPGESTESITEANNSEPTDADFTDSASENTNSPEPGSTAPTTPLPIADEDSKPWIKSLPGIVTLSISAVLITAGVLIGGFWALKKKRESPSVEVAVEVGSS
ncbi:unnamed protein product [Allacma fusca]|uniref:Calcium-activated chloride channel N-terminal domain-containing protein n=1 Tax=Allacma fusca TaxID=39272 RepID=A0A8J2PJG7_9HEXA|nr:unnamed protein product [Allacma fusca]